MMFVEHREYFAAPLEHREQGTNLPEKHRLGAWNLPWMKSCAWDCACYGSIVAPESADVTFGLKAAADFLTAGFHMTRTGELEYTIAGHHVLLRLLEKDDAPVREYSSFAWSDWTDCFHLNALCRNTKNLERICHKACLDYATHYSDGSRGVRCSKDCWPHANALLALHNDESGRVIGQYLVDALQIIVKKEEQIGQREYANYIFGHEIALLMAAINRAPNFEDQLADALEQYKKFYTSFDDEPDPDPQFRPWNRPHGFLAINLLGIAAMAWDWGMRFEIDSEYLPMRFVTGEFLK